VITYHQEEFNREGAIRPLVCGEKGKIKNKEG
jgi:hypothetical protein